MSVVTRRPADVSQVVDLVEIYADSDDLEALAVLLDHIRDLKSRLASAELDLQAQIAALVRGQQATAGDWRIERRGGRDRKQWQSEELFSELVAQSNVDENGCPRKAGEARDALVEAVRECIPLTGSLSWRAGALRKLGIEPDEWCTSEPGRVRVEVHRVDHDQNEEES